MDKSATARRSRSSSEIGSAYRGRAGDQYAESYRVFADVGPKINCSNFSPYLSPSSTVVDFGCGDGGVLANLDVDIRIGVEATDIGREMARQRGFNQVVRSLEELDDEIADAVISNHALEHTINPARELSEMLRILRRGGTMVLWLPLDDWRTQRRPDPADPDHHLYTWTPLLLANLLTEVGFEVRHCGIVERAFPPKLHLAVRLLGPERVAKIAELRAFDIMCAFSAKLSRRRQVKAIAVRPVQS